MSNKPGVFHTPLPSPHEIIPFCVCCLCVWMIPGLCSYPAAGSSTGAWRWMLFHTEGKWHSKNPHGPDHCERSVRRMLFVKQGCHIEIKTLISVSEMLWMFQLNKAALLLLKMFAPLGQPGQELPKGSQALHKAHLQWAWHCRNIDNFKSLFLFE